MNNKKILISSLLLIAGTVFAQGSNTTFKSYMEVDSFFIKVPTVVEALVGYNTERYDVAVFDKTNNSFQPLYFREENKVREEEIDISSSINSAQAYKMIDKDTSTYAEFLLPEYGRGEIKIFVNSQKAFNASQFTILLDNNVALPNTVEVKAVVDTTKRIVLATQKLDQRTVFFPQTFSKQWEITFAYSQPLRITELKIEQRQKEISNKYIRFLAQPNHQYRVYISPDRVTNISVGESGNLRSADNVRKIGLSGVMQNPEYVMADTDKDGIADIYDNCVSASNKNQEDVDGNGRGDACDDFDQDGIININDNCVNDPNRSQSDEDSDGIGDVCDSEESRVTEKLPWLPWAGIGFALFSVIFMFAWVARKK